VIHPTTKAQPKKISDSLEENFIAITLGVMTLLTFANVIARYVFNSNILWALETTVFLFAWLVLIGASYCVRKNTHLGVDVVVNLLPAGARRLTTLLAVAASLLFCGLVFYGALTYWLPFAGERAWYEVDDIPMPEALQFLATTMNEGERWEKLPRFIPYFCLPLGFGLLMFRFIQKGIAVWNDGQLLIIASHDSDATDEDAVDNSHGADA